MQFPIQPQPKRPLYIYFPTRKSVILTRPVTSDQILPDREAIAPRRSHSRSQLCHMQVGAERQKGPEQGKP